MHSVGLINVEQSGGTRSSEKVGKQGSDGKHRQKMATEEEKGETKLKISEERRRRTGFGKE